MTWNYGGNYGDGLLKARRPGLPGARGQLGASELGLKIAALGPRREIADAGDGAQDLDRGAKGFDMGVGVDLLIDLTDGGVIASIRWRSVRRPVSQKRRNRRQGSPEWAVTVYRGPSARTYSRTDQVISRPADGRDTRR